MVLVLAPVEAALSNASGFGSLGNCRSDNLGCVAVSAVADLVGQAFLASAGRGKRFTAFIIDQLAKNVLVAAVNRQTWSLAATLHLLADTIATTPTTNIIDFDRFHSSIPIPENNSNQPQKTR